MNTILFFCSDVFSQMPLHAVLESKCLIVFRNRLDNWTNGKLKIILVRMRTFWCQHENEHIFRITVFTQGSMVHNILVPSHIVSTNVEQLNIVSAFRRRSDYSLWHSACPLALRSYRIHPFILLERTFDRVFILIVRFLACWHLFYLFSLA